MQDRGISQHGKEKMIGLRIKPYVQEAILQMVLDVIITTLVLIFLNFVGFHNFISIAIVLAYFIFAFLLHYRIVLLALLDKKAQGICSEIVKIESFINEYSFAGDRFGHSNIRFFYAREMQVNKYKIKIIDSKGEVKKLRSVMSFKRSFKLATLDKYQIEYVMLTYLKKSSILIKVELAKELDKNISRKKREEIIKTINYINSTI